MKFLWMRTPIRCARRRSLVALASALLLTCPLFVPASLQARPTPASNNHAVADIPGVPHFAAKVFPVHGAPKCKVIFTRGASAVTVRLRNEAGQLLFAEVVTAPAYSRRFDLSELPDARYYFELQTGEERYVQVIQLDTQASRTLVVR